MLRVQKKRQTDVKKLMPEIMKWHGNLREKLVKSGSEKPTHDKKWGRLKPSKRFNVDQVPLPFSIQPKSTYEVPLSSGKQRKDHGIWVAQLGNGLDNRQSTLQLCFSPEKVVKPALIFRGKGKRISKDELMAYDKDVDVYWQPNAWADTNFCLEWIKGTFSKAVSDIDEYVLFCDNLKGQANDEFKSEVRMHSGIVWYGIPNRTHFWQPVDAGPGKTFVSLVKQAQQEWLEHDENIELWLGNDNRKLTAKQRRILIEIWVGDAFRKFSTVEKYKKMCYRSFEKTGCLITVDGSDDDKIQPESMHGYIVPPPLDVRNTIEVVDAHIPEALDEPEDVLPESDVEQSDDEDLNGMEEEIDDGNIFSILFE